MNKDERRSVPRSPKLTRIYLKSASDHGGAGRLASNPIISRLIAANCSHLYTPPLTVNESGLRLMVQQKKQLPFSFSDS